MEPPDFRRLRLALLWGGGTGNTEKAVTGDSFFAENKRCILWEEKMYPKKQKIEFIHEESFGFASRWDVCFYL